MSLIFQMKPQGVATGKLGCQVPNTSAGDFDVVRASVKTRITDEQEIESIADGIASVDYLPNDLCPVLKTEPVTINLYLTPSVLITQDIATAADVYTVSFYGTGTITFSGSFVGSLVGTGTNERVQLTFTATAGTLTSTVVGSVTDANAENKEYATSFIVGTRQADEVTGAEASFNDTEGIMQVNIAALSDDLSFREMSVNSGVSSERAGIRYLNSSNSVNGTIVAGGVEVASFTYEIPDITVLTYVQLLWNGTYAALKVNGVQVEESFTSVAPTGLSTCSLTSGGGAENFYGYTKEINVYDNTDTFASTFTTFNAMADFAQYNQQ